jgi:RND family efflux transporter MFP subunit
MASALVYSQAKSFGGGQQPSEKGSRSLKKLRAKTWVGSAVAIGILGGGLFLASHLFARTEVEAVAPLPSAVTISAPIEEPIAPRLQFLGQFAAVEHVELRAQVGGTLTQIGFKDGDVVHNGDLLFTIDPRQYEIRLAQANAQLETATAHLALADQQLARAEQLVRTSAGTVQNVDQRRADQQAAQAAVDDAKAQIRDAQFDLDHCRITAPFTGRIGTHLVSVGNLISGSRAGSSPTTLLATIVSLDPIYLNFDMSEADYMAFMRERQKQGGPLADKVEVSLSDETDFAREGTLDFIDNALDRSSGTIHARATIPNGDHFLTPGGFARVRVALAPPSPALLVPDAAILPDQSGHIVLTVGPNDVVTPKRVEVGDLRGGLRVVRSGLTTSDQVIIDGIPIARPGSKVSPHSGSIHFASDRS